MLPLIRSGLDAVHIKKKQAPPKVGDVVFYRRANGDLVLHRIVGSTQSGYTLCGDNQTFLEKNIREDQIVGILAGYYRGKRYIDCSKRLSLCFSVIWRGVYPVRRIASGVARRLRGGGLLGQKAKDTLTWLGDVIGGEKKKLFFLSLMNLVQGFVFPTIALLLKNIIDIAVKGQLRQLVFSCCLLFALIVVQVLLHAATNRLSAQLTIRIKKSIRKRLFGNVLWSEYLPISKFHSGDIVNRMIWDTDRISSTLADSFPNTVLKITQLLMVGGYLLILDPWLGLAAAAYGAVSMLILAFSRKKIRQLYDQTRKEEGRLFSFVQEAFVNILLVKGANLYQSMDMRDSLREENVAEKASSQNRYSIRMHLAIEFLLRMGFAFLVAWCAFGVASGRLSPGSLTALALMSVQIQSQFIGVSQSVAYFISMMAAVDRLRDLDELQKEPKISLDQTRSVVNLYAELDEIVLDDVCYGYNERLVLENASLRIQKGEFVAVTGVSGIGKSTFLRLLLGVISPSSGKVLLGNWLAGRVTRGLFAYIPQDSALFSGTIRENVTLFCTDADDVQIMQALECSCAKEFVNKLPRGLETEIGEHGTGLSVGQVQRLAIARALLCDAPILLLDEGTSALDGKTEEQVLQNLKAIEGKTIVAITHREAVLQKASSHYVLENRRFFRK